MNHTTEGAQQQRDVLFYQMVCLVLEVRNHAHGCIQSQGLVMTLSKGDRKSAVEILVILVIGCRITSACTTDLAKISANANVDEGLIRQSSLNLR